MIMLTASITFAPPPPLPPKSNITWTVKKQGTQYFHSLCAWSGRQRILLQDTLRNKAGNISIAKYWGAFLQQFLQWKSNKYYIFWVCVCSLRYPACNAHAPYFHLWPDPLYNILPHFLINGTFFFKVIECKMYVLIFSINFVWNISHSKKKWARYDRQCTLVCM